MVGVAQFQLQRVHTWFQLQHCLGLPTAKVEVVRITRNRLTGGGKSVTSTSR